MEDVTELPGLSEDSPDGFMAALGLLRVLTEDLDQSVRLSWDGVARIHGPGREQLLSLLKTHMRERHLAPEWNWADVTRKVSPERYTEVLQEHGGDERFVRFLAGFVTPTIHDKKGFLARTRLDMASGTQKLLGALRELARKMSDKEELAAAFFEEALFAGRYRRSYASFGWDPSTVQDHAYSSKAPSELKATSRPGMVWLVAESLALHPVLPVRGRAVTTGTGRVSGRTVYYWPVWEGEADLAWVRAVRRVPLERLGRVAGVRRIWTSAFGKSGKGDVLRSPVRYEPTSDSLQGSTPQAVVI